MSNIKERSPRKELSREVMVIEPRTRIASFDTLGYYTSMAVNGAIAGTLFGKDKDKKSVFYKSRVNLKNKQMISQLTSQVYSYLNGTISEFADPEDYFFRLWIRIEIDRKTGEILGDPLFDVDLFKYVGKLGGKYVEVGSYSLDVVFVGKKGTHIEPIFVKGINRVARETKLVKFKPFESYAHAPSEIQGKITTDAPYLVIGDKPIEIKLKIDERTTTIVPYCEIKRKTVDFKTKEAVEHFILSQIKLKPEIRRSATAFQLVDAELRKIEGKIQKSAIESDEPDLLATIGMEKTLEKLKLQFEKINVGKLRDNRKMMYQKHLKQLDKLQDNFVRLSGDWQGLRKDVEDAKGQFDEGEITFEQLSTIKVRRYKALKRVEQLIIDFQDKLKSQFVPAFEEFLSGLGVSEK